MRTGGHNGAGCVTHFLNKGLTRQPVYRNLIGGVRRIGCCAASGQSQDRFASGETNTNSRREGGEDAQATILQGAHGGFHMRIIVDLPLEALQHFEERRVPGESAPGLPLQAL